MDAILPPQQSKTDETLAQETQAGQPESFGLLVGRFEPKLKRYGTKFLREPEDIEDLVQEIFVRAYQNIQSYNSAQPFSPWIYRIAHNLFVNELRKRSRRPFFSIDLDSLVSHPLSSEVPERASEEREMKAMVEKGLAGLSEQYREVIILYYEEELSYREIADVLQVPVGTVGVRLARAKAALVKVYEKLNLSYDF